MTVPDVRPVVAKFGGTSLADAAQIEKVVALVTADPARRFLVVSAPGKRSGDDAKVTDLLLEVADGTDRLDQIRARFEQIAAGLGVGVDLAAEFAKIAARLGEGRDYLASRGEYLNATLIAARLGWPMVDAATVVRFSDDGELQPEVTADLLAEALGDGPAVIPGFYGATRTGKIVTFSRGGSDVTGALVAAAVGAQTYENWTDVSGILMADPRVVDSPRPIARLPYTALRALTYLGASVLHEDAIAPVRAKGIPLNIRNTNAPADPGTWVQADLPPARPGDPALLGLAGRRGYTALTLRRSQLSGSRGCARLLEELDTAGVRLDMALTSVDTWTVVTSTPPVELAPVVERLNQTTDDIATQPGLALIGAVESGAVPRTVVAARLAGALADAGIDVHLLDSSAGVHIAAIPADRLDDAVRTLYSALCEARFANC